jgi:hypothetical protein
MLFIEIHFRGGWCYLWKAISLKYYSTGGKGDSDDCIDVPCPASDYWHAYLLFFSYYPFICIFNATNLSI